MAIPNDYIITLSDGTGSVTVTANTINTSFCSLRLFGQNKTLYGEGVNENFLDLLENFANTAPPVNPIPGQIWFKTDPTYDAGFSCIIGGADTGDGDFLPRIRIHRTGTSDYWTTLVPTIVDSDLPNTRADYTVTPGHLWLDVNPADDAIPLTNVAYDHSILKVYDPIANDWISVAANYVLLKGNQTVTGDIEIDGAFNVTGATTLSSTLGVTGATTLSSTLGVTGATTLSSTLGVTGATTLSDTLNVTGASNMIGVATFSASGTSVVIDHSASIGDNLTIVGDLSVGTSTSLNTLSVASTSNMTGLVTINLTNPATTALSVVGGVAIVGDISVTGPSVGNITTSSNVIVGDTLTVANNINVNTGTITCLDIDVTNHTVKNLLDPVNPYDAATKHYIDAYYLRRDTGISSTENTMSAILYLDNVSQNSAANSATTKQYVDNGLALKVNKAGDTMTGLLTIDMGGSGTGLNVSGDANVTNLLTTNDLVVNDVAIFNGSFNARNTLKVFTDRVSVESKYIESLTMRTTPLPADVPNVQYITDAINSVQGNSSRINPTLPNVAKEGDIQVISSPLSVSIYANGDWRQVFPAVYA